jgi:IclR family KDG regulon transcriptional repressor
MLTTVAKVGQVLALFTSKRPEWGVSEVAGSLGVPKSTAHALLSTMATIGLLKRRSRGRYRLGWRLLTLSQILMETSDFRHEARRWMEELVAEFGETVHLAALELGRVVYVEKMAGTRAVRVDVTSVGVELPAHCSGVGKMLLSDLPWEKVLEIIGRHGMIAYTPNTITEPEELRRELERARERGYAYDIEEVVPELCCTAAPIRGFGGQVIAAMSLSVPAYRFEEYREMYTRALVEATNNVSDRLADFDPKMLADEATVGH